MSLADRSLANELIETVPRFLTLLRQKVTLHARSELTMPQLRMVSKLKAGPLGNSDLADRCGVDITSMSRMADSLVKRGFVTRSVNPDDKRCVKLQLTAKGRREQEALASVLGTWVASSMPGLSSADRAELSSGLRALARLEALMLNSLDEGARESVRVVSP